MATVRSFNEASWVQVVPGFEIAEIFKNDAVGIVHIRMRKPLTHYPPNPEEWSTLSTNMDVTVLIGLVFFQEKGKEPVKCWFGDTVNIPKDTEYRWILDTPMVVLQATNNPPFRDEDRKV